MSGNAEKMRAVDYVEPGQIRARTDASVPTPGAGEVVVQVRACGICGSDLHMYRDGSYGDRLTRPTPEGYKVPGHEFAGTIAALGDGVKDWSIGERVVGVTGFGGAMADYVTVPVNPFQLVRIPDGVSDSDAATTEPMADALQMVRKAQIKDGENVVIFGVGLIGLGVVQVIRAKGIKVGAIVAVDVWPARLDAALKAGATHGVNARDGDVFDAVAAITGVETTYAGTSAKIGVVFDCAGYIKTIKGPPPLETALRLVDPGGRIICFGAFEGAMTVDMSPLIQKQPTIMGSNGYASGELVEALDLMAQGRVDRASLITHHLPIEQAAEAFEAQCAPDAVKVMITMN